jgi:hypothetical protein
MRSLVEAKPAARGAATGPRFATPYGFLAVLRRDPLGFLVDCRRRYGDGVRILPGGRSSSRTRATFGTSRRRAPPLADRPWP